MSGFRLPKFRRQYWNSGRIAVSAGSIHPQVSGIRYSREAAFARIQVEAHHVVIHLRGHTEHMSQFVDEYGQQVKPTVCGTVFGGIHA